MAISRIGTPGTGTTSCTFPTHQAGDLLIVFAFRDGSNTAPALPATWWNYFTETGANTCTIRVGYKIATGAGTSSGTWTNATSVIGVVYRGATLGALISGRGSSTTFSYNAISTMAFNNSTSWVGAFVASRDGTNTTVPNVQIAPTGMTNVVSVKDATDAAGFHDTNGTVSSWSTQTQATGVAATGWYTLVFELVETQTNILGYNVIGGSTNSLTDYFVGASFDCTEAFTANVGKFYGNQNSGSGTYDFAIYEETSLNNYTFLSQATGTITVGTTPAWNSFVINQALTVGKRYYIAFWSVDPFTFYFNTGARVGTTYATTGNTFNTWPSPELGGITDTAFMSMYIENAAVSVDPGVGQATMTGYAPTVTASDHISVTPGLGQGTFTGQEPTVTASNNISVSTAKGDGLFDGFAPTVNLSANTNVATDTGAATLAGFSPTIGITNNTFVDSDLGLVVLNGFAPSVSATNHINVATSLGQALLTGFEPSVIITNNINVQSELGQGLFTGIEPTVSITNHVNVSTSTGQGLFTGYDPTVSAGNNTNVSPGTGLGVYTGYSPTVNATANVNIQTQTGSALLNGFSPIVSATEHINISTGLGQGVFSGYNPTITASNHQAVSPGTGLGSFTGYAPIVIVQAAIPKPSHSINFTFVKQPHVVNFISIKRQHSINYTFVRTSHTIDTE